MKGEGSGRDELFLACFIVGNIRVTFPKWMRKTSVRFVGSRPRFKYGGFRIRNSNVNSITVTFGGE
jgi:hypothetical protein